ncbi:hypothetical protein ACJMK2_018362 [Sinanodonta woodiana]|uniref:FAM20 C-terminal domain-containing protein n=1 Tax=Sinanodonta woodiana TaxID=1069815 RepID=A0ABD3UF82_SINWO
MSSSWNLATIFVVEGDGKLQAQHEYEKQQRLNKNARKIWEKCNQTITEESIYKPTTDVKEVIDALRHVKIVKADLYLHEMSSAYKWMLILEGGQQVLFKPVLTLFELGNMPYVTGRRISWDQEITSVATEGLRKSVRIQEGGDVCITWRCYSKRISAYCFEKGIIYGAVIYWIGIGTVTQRGNDKGIFHHDFHAMGSHLENFSPILPGNRTYCDEFREKEPYKSDTFSFGHILDMAAIDFLLMNYDGGKFTYIANTDQTVYLNILSDYGLSFCNREDPILLAPIYQCCNIRKSTYKNLMLYATNLTEVFDDATKDDPLYPLLLPRDITAMHQRLNTIIAIVQICLKKYGETGVFV